MAGETLPPSSLLTEDDIRLIILESGFSNTSYPDFVVNELNAKAPILGNFLVTELPAGTDSPERIRQQWIGLSLPVRCQGLDFEGAVPVLAIEAMLELKKAGRLEAYNWWMREYESDWRLPLGYTPGDFPEFLAYTNFLIFNQDEGQMQWGDTT